MESTKVRDVIKLIEHDGWRSARTRDSHRQSAHLERPGLVENKKAEPFASGSDPQVADAAAMLAIDRSIVALNASSDCWAVKPSASAREKLAIIPF